MGSRSGPEPLRPVETAEDAQVRVGTALALLELAAQVLEHVPPPKTALDLGDREFFRYLQAAEAARAWLVGQEEGAGVERPAPGSVLGDAPKVYAWDEAETEQHFTAALRDRNVPR